MNPQLTSSWTSMSHVRGEKENIGGGAPECKAGYRSMNPAPTSFQTHLCRARTVPRRSVARQAGAVHGALTNPYAWRGPRRATTARTPLTFSLNSSEGAALMRLHLGG